METRSNQRGGDMRTNFLSRPIGVRRTSLVLLLSLFIPTAAMPQRYGRPYSLASIPQLLLQVSAQKKTHYFSVYDLEKMPRSILADNDPNTNQTHVYEGVALDRLVPTSGHHSKDERVDIEYGSHQRLTIPGSALDTSTELIVVDTVDGKRLSADAPYSLVAKFPRKPALRISGVHRVDVRIS